MNNIKKYFKYAVVLIFFIIIVVATLKLQENDKVGHTALNNITTNTQAAAVVLPDIFKGTVPRVYNQTIKSGFWNNVLPRRRQVVEGAKYYERITPDGWHLRFYPSVNGGEYYIGQNCDVGGSCRDNVKGPLQLNSKGVQALLTKIENSPVYTPPINNRANKTAYTPLVLGMLNIDVNNVGDLFNRLFRIALLIGSVLAVLMIAIAGLLYMTTDSASAKTGQKKRIQDALTGLLMLLGVWLFYSTINPNILNINFKLAPVTIKGSEVVTPPTIDPVVQKEGDRRVIRAQKAIINWTPQNNEISVTWGQKFDTGAGYLPESYYIKVSKINGRASCSNPIDPLYTKNGPGGLASQCSNSINDQQNFSSDTQACCVYKINTDALQY